MVMRIVRVVVLGMVLAGPAFAQDAGTVVFKEEGRASYYGDELQGHRTASGARYEPDQLTAAHPSLPLGTEVTVTDPATGRKVEVEVNDRGPYADGRDIDLSKGAAEALGIARQGVADVKIEATKAQVEQAIDTPKETPKVQRELDAARTAAAAEGTPQPAAVPLTRPAP
jgi:rare lipoprotein A